MSDHETTAPEFTRHFTEQRILLRVLKSLFDEPFSTGK